MRIKEEITLRIELTPPEWQRLHEALAALPFCPTLTPAGITIPARWDDTLAVVAEALSRTRDGCRALLRQFRTADYVVIVCPQCLRPAVDFEARNQNGLSAVTNPLQMRNGGNPI